jgi:3-methyladenine DNA glycosylase AlkC
MGPPLATEGDWGMAPFELLPHSTWIATYALDVPDAAFDAMHALTKRFTAEFAMRPYLERWTELSFRRLERWVDDPDAHVRRAASEGTRLRLPWGARVAALTADPTRALRLITPLRDDPSSYVRRSVANHLNDIGKQDPALLLATCRSWIVDAPAPRRDLLRHALRDRVKKGDRDAIALLGAGGGDVAVRAELPDGAALGDAIRVRVFVVNRGSSPTRAVVDLAVSFPGTRAEGRNKVFKVATVDLAPGVEVELRKSISLKDHTTRAARAGPHVLEAQVDGRRVPLGVVEVR